MGILFLCIIVVTTMSSEIRKVSGAEDLPCKIHFADDAAQIKTLKDCATKHKYDLKINETLEEIVKEMELLESKDFDDGCFTKCWYGSFGAIEKNGKISANGMDAFFKSSNISAPLLKELTSLFQECVKMTESKFTEEKEMPCKLYTMNDACYFKKIQKNVKELNKLC